ncbi:hypothetical protein Tco_1126953, partial [Tanacetum coccineum]
SDYKSLLVYCGREIELGRCAGRRGMNKKKKGVAEGDKGLIEAMKIWLPQAEHRHYTHHVYANFKKKWTRLHYKRLFWGAATSTLEQDFTSKMREIRALDEGAYGVRLISKQLQVALLLRMEYQSPSMLKYFLLEFSIKPVYGSKMWQSIINTPPLLPIVKTMSGRPRKNMIKHLSELDDQHHVSRVGKGSLTCPKVLEARGFAKGSGTMGRGSTIVGRGSISKRSGSAGSTSMGRGYSSMKGGHDGSTAMGRGSRSKRGRTARKGFDDSNNTEREHNGRIYQDWDQVSQDELFKGPTLSVLEAVDEAIQEHNDGLPSISEGQFHSLNQASGNSEHPISQPAPTLLETTTEESHTPRAPRPRPQIMPRGKSERIAKKRKFNYPADGTGKTPDKPFSL